ncbi:MAG TPA: HAD-IIIC family phosphatase [Caulobacteraceae bacterium]|nr:HAD-IIIC family phosphatase [Caulobacteraceae bacterium]
MALRKSSFVHVLPVGPGRWMALHAVTHNRIVVDGRIAGLIEHFQIPREPPPGVPPNVIQALVERGYLTAKTAQQEAEETSRELGAFYGRDPDDMLHAWRRRAMEGPDPYWAAGPALSAETLGGERLRMDVLLFGDCDLHMESGFLTAEAGRRGIDLRVAATFASDLSLAGEHPHQAIIIGALVGRHAIAGPYAPGEGRPPHQMLLDQTRQIVEALRKLTSAPILIDNLPEPTVQPLGMAERGRWGHRNRFRAADLDLAELAEAYGDVHVVDVAAALAAAGSERMLDDGQFGYTHFGSPGWMLQRPEAEKAAVHGLFPDPAALAATLDGDPYGREKVMARAHLDALITVTGFDRKKCVIVDLDGVLWPGVLAETGAPFAWSQEVSPPFSYVGLYFGIHEALQTLKRRGVLLACVSKNDEAVVRELWRFSEGYPPGVMLSPSDFVSLKINWRDKASNIRDIAEALGFGLDAFVFVDDHPAERERVRQMLPEVETWGEDLFSLRRRLLSDPRLMTPRLTAEAAARTATTQAQMVRQTALAEAPDEAAFLASLQVRTRVERLAPGADLDRVAELLARTTQFNTTGIKPPASELKAMLGQDDAAIFVMHVADRFGDHGLVGAAVVQAGEILGLAISCRVLSLGVEQALLSFIVGDWGGPGLHGRITPTARNGPVRNLYRDGGFTLGPDGAWRRDVREAG